jgi:microcystin-dependent protein
MEPIVGQLMIVAFNFAPQNWLLCDGTTYAISQYEALFTLIGNKYGGDGVNYFCVPDLRGRFPMGQGAGNGLSPITLGQIGGTATITPQVSSTSVGSGSTLITYPDPTIAQNNLPPYVALNYIICWNGCYPTQGY